MSDKMLSNDFVLVNAVAQDLAEFAADQDPRLDRMPWEEMNSPYQEEMRRAARSVLSSIQSRLNERYARNEKGLCLTYWHGVEPMGLKGKYPTD